jgi:3-oxoadipate enol-lactonase
LPTELPLIDVAAWAGFERVSVAGPAGSLSVRVGGPVAGSAVLFNHSILTGSAIWRRQAASLAQRGYRVLCLDTRGHGQSAAPQPPYAMDDLVADNLAVLDALQVQRAHFIGVSLGGMTGFGLGSRHGDRVLSLCIVAARADAPAPFAAAWDERIALARDKGIEPLVKPTAERWFGAAFLTGHPETRDALIACIRETNSEGFIGCARAIQGLSYLDAAAQIRTPTTLVIGTRDELLLQPMKDLVPVVPGSRLVTIEGAGHLPQIDRPDDFDRMLDQHFGQFADRA